MTRVNDYRLDRLYASLISRNAELERQLSMKDQTKPFNQNHGFAYLFTGRERLRIEQEKEFVTSLMAMIDN